MKTGSGLKIPCGHFCGEISVPPSKSLTHRMLILAALSGHPCLVENFLESEDTLRTLNGLGQMGFVFRNAGRQVEFSGEQKKPEKPVNIYVGNSGTTARLLTAVAALQKFPVQIDGDHRMRQRPMKPLLDALCRLGARVEHSGGGFPVKIAGGSNIGGRVFVDTSASSQFVSALMLIAPVTRRGIQINLKADLPSRSYVEMTEALLRQAGVYLDAGKTVFKIPGEQTYRQTRWMVESDYSSAAYFLTAAAISKGWVLLNKMPVKSLQGDRVILDILRTSGAKIEWEEQNVRLKADRINGIEYDCQKCPDLVPTLAVMALFATGSTVLKNISHLKYKESDRIEAILNNIRLLHGNAELKNEDLIIRPKTLVGAKLPSYDDHRIAMSFALAGLRLQNVSIENPACVKKSFPGFWDCFLPNIRSDDDFEKIFDTGKIRGVPNGFRG